MTAMHSGAILPGSLWIQQVLYTRPSTPANGDQPGESLSTRTVNGNITIHSRVDAPEDVFIFTGSFQAIPRANYTPGRTQVSCTFKSSGTLINPNNRFLNKQIHLNFNVLPE